MAAVAGCVALRITESPYATSRASSAAREPALDAVPPSTLVPEASERPIADRFNAASNAWSRGCGLAALPMPGLKLLYGAGT